MLSSKSESVFDDVKREGNWKLRSLSPRLDQLARDGDRLAISIGPMYIYVHHSQCISKLSLSQEDVFMIPPSGRIDDLYKSLLAPSIFPIMCAPKS